MYFICFRGGNAAQPPPPQPNPQPPNNAMVEQLNQNKAGQATNAEDFTKQFMSEMFGGQQPPPKFQPEVTPVGQMPKAPTAPGQTFTKTSLQGPVQKVCFITVCEFSVHLCFFSFCVFRNHQLHYPNQLSN